MMTVCTMLALSIIFKKLSNRFRRSALSVTDILMVALNAWRNQNARFAILI
jgi:hypothetical protein